MKYKIVHASCSEDLEDEIDLLIREGWKPLGGVAVTLTIPLSKLILFQAMVKDT